jgi:hypothetical protein
MRLVDQVLIVLSVLKGVRVEVWLKIMFVYNFCCVSEKPEMRVR